MQPTPRRKIAAAWFTSVFDHSFQPPGQGLAPQIPYEFTWKVWFVSVVENIWKTCKTVQTTVQMFVERPLEKCWPFILFLDALILEDNSPKTTPTSEELNALGESQKNVTINRTHQRNVGSLEVCPLHIHPLLSMKLDILYLWDWGLSATPLAIVTDPCDCYGTRNTGTPKRYQNNEFSRFWS